MQIKSFKKWDSEETCLFAADSVSSLTGSDDIKPSYRLLVTSLRNDKGHLL